MFKNLSFTDYVFSLYTGILVTSIFYFAIYCILKKNKPEVNPKAILPGLVSGWVSDYFDFFFVTKAK